jgi:RNA polymerase sigma-70 factor
MGFTLPTYLERLFERAPDSVRWVNLNRPGFEARLAAVGSDIDDERLFELALVFGCVSGDEAAIAVFEAGILDRIPELRANRELRQDVRVHALVGTNGAPGRLASFGARGPLVHWVRRMARNLVTTRLRGESKTASRADDESMLTDDRSPESSILASEVSDRFREAFATAIDSLPTHDRECLRLRYVEGLSVGSIALKLGIHRETAGIRLANATQLLGDRTRAGLVGSFGATIDDIDATVTDSVRGGDVESLARLLAHRRY